MDPPGSLAWIRQLATPLRETFITHEEPALSDALRFRVEHDLGWSARTRVSRDGCALGRYVPRSPTRAKVARLLLHSNLLGVIAGKSARTRQHGRKTAAGCTKIRCLPLIESSGKLQHFTLVGVATNVGFERIDAG